MLPFTNGFGNVLDVRQRSGGRVETRRIVWRLKAQRLPHAQRDSPFTRRVWKVIPLGSSPRRATRCPALGNHEASIANALETTARPHTSRMVVVKPAALGYFLLQAN